MFNNYSSTYAVEIAKLLGVFALIIGFELPEETEVIVGALLVLISSLYSLFVRYRDGKRGVVGEVNILGVRQ